MSTIISIASLRDRVTNSPARNKYIMLKYAELALDGDYQGYSVQNQLVEYTILDNTITLTNTVTQEVDSYIDPIPEQRFVDWVEGDWELIIPSDTTEGQIV